MELEMTARRSCTESSPWECAAKRACICTAHTREEELGVDCCSSSAAAYRWQRSERVETQRLACLRREETVFQGKRLDGTGECT